MTQACGACFEYEFLPLHPFLAAPCVEGVDPHDGELRTILILVHATLRG